MNGRTRDRHDGRSDDASDGRIDRPTDDANDAPTDAPTDDLAAAREAARQRALIGALFARGDIAPPDGLHERDARARRGLEAYRANAEALAERALAAVYPRIRTMVGEDDFAHVAAALWRSAPPARGDVGEWGEALPDWLAASPLQADGPYLADCARLDLALHRCERAADAAFDASSLALLGSEDPARLRLDAMPGTALIVSDWPIVTILQAHETAEPAAAERAFAGVRAALAAGRAETALVRRDGWRACADALAPADAAFTAALLRGDPLGRALEAAPAQFDFAVWLAKAIEGRWLKGAARIAD